MTLPSRMDPARCGVRRMSGTIRMPLVLRLPVEGGAAPEHERLASVSVTKTGWPSSSWTCG